MPIINIGPMHSTTCSLVIFPSDDALVWDLADNIIQKINTSPHTAYAHTYIPSLIDSAWHPSQLALALRQKNKIRKKHLGVPAAP